jgi:predicted transcriptional regulator of viral defense system
MSIDDLKPFFIEEKPFTLEEVAKRLSISLRKATVLLYNYKKQGHVLKLQRGIYLPVSHKGLSPEETFGDPWVIVPLIFPDSYIGGWTASNYWKLTDQLFRTTCIMINKPVYKRKKKIGRFEYAVFRNSFSESTGIEIAWRDQVQVPISDVHKTVIDMLENPKCGAGIQHTIDCLKVYFEEFYEEKTFISYIQHIKTGAFFKRLGYIVEILLGADHLLCKISKERLTKGDIPIDSSMHCPKLITHWHLYVNEEIDL